MSSYIRNRNTIGLSGKAIVQQLSINKLLIKAKTALFQEDYIYKFWSKYPVTTEVCSLLVHFFKMRCLFHHTRKNSERLIRSPR